MRSYGQYCPIIQASELLAERWSIHIPRNIMVGCQTFTDDRYPAKGPPCAGPVTPRIAADPDVLVAQRHALRGRGVPPGPGLIPSCCSLTARVVSG
jgi:hypothetical protein